MINMKKIAQILPPLIAATLLFSCVTTSEKEFPRWRQTSFTLYDGSENVIQSLSIAYGEKDKPSEILISGPDGNEIGRRLLTFNEGGKIERMENVSAGGSSLISEYTYDEAGFLLSLRTMDEKGNVLVTAEYINDDRGNPVEWTSRYSRGGDSVHFLIEYDERGKVTKTTELDPSGDPLYYSTSEYDEKGNELVYAIFSPEGILDQKLVSRYDEGALAGTEIIDGDGAVLYRTDYQLNEEKLPVLISNYNQYGDKSDYSELSYNEAGRETEMISHEYDGTMREKIIHLYDGEGNNTEIIIYGPSGEISSITRNTFENLPLRMTPEEFQSLVFNQP